MSKRLRNYLPALKYGHKIDANDIAGMLGLPYVGNIFYVDPTNGHDTSNEGTSQEQAYKTAGVANAATANYNHDVTVIVPGGTAGTAETANVAYSNHYSHVVGNTAPNGMSQRSRILTTTDAVDPCFTISGRGCSFVNIQMGTFQASNDVLVSLTGARNYFDNVHFAGIGHATAGDDTSARCISMSGAEENLFSHCTIGTDTIFRSTTNASLELASASTRNVFEDCLFPIYADNAGALFVKAASAADIDRFVHFKNCMFHNPAYSSATTMTTAFSIHAAVGGSVILDGCSVLGVTDWSDDYTAVTGCNMPDITAANAGFMETIAT